MSLQKEEEWYHKVDSSPVGPCQYQVWDAEKKCLGPCGEPGHVWTDGWHTTGTRSAMLCDLHGAFVSDAVRDAKPMGVGDSLMSGGKIAVVTGSESGLGAAIAVALESKGYVVVRYDLRMGRDVRNPHPESLPSKVDVLVNCAGVNRIGWLQDVTERDWDEVMDTNVKGIFLMTQALLPALRATKGTVLNIVSNAAHMPMRCSAAYNASKGAALILTKQLARELAPDITVFSISPNKIAGTGMSHSIDKQVMQTRGWTAEQARNYQLSSLLTGEETPVDCIAEFVGFLLQDKRHHKYLAGCDIPYGA